MAIDFNHASGEVAETHNASNSNNGDCSSSSCSSNSSPWVSSSVYSELWRACAGPHTSLPNQGDVIVYCPQGHLEQAASSSSSSPSFPSSVDVLSFDLPPQIFCRVLNVQLLANKENDEVYTRLTLLPQPPELLGLNSEGRKKESGAHRNEDDGDGDGELPARSTPHMFCKTLTASDTSTHGGFSVPRRAAEDCFPPLDYKVQRPSQELVAKDLHGVEWRFCHIYRGQPRRHLLTTGWSIFVSQKHLVSGDAVLFLRGEDGELSLGIRRALRPRDGLPSSITGSQNSYVAALSPVAYAISTKSTFDVFYSPRATHPEFVVPYLKYITSITNPICVGSRFKMRFDRDDASEKRRCTGVVSRISDMDPYRWPKSKWRSFVVKWEEDKMSDHQERVSPWEIDPSVSLPPFSVQSSQRFKKLRTSQLTASPDKPLTGGVGYLDFEESVRSSTVLQGQENMSFMSPFFKRETANNPSNFDGLQSAMGNPYGFSLAKSSIYTGGLVESADRFPKVVLQGQEIYPFRSLTSKHEYNLSGRTKPSNVYLPWDNPLQGGSNPLTGFTNFPREIASIRSLYVPVRNEVERTKLEAPEVKHQENSISTSSSRDGEGNLKNGVLGGGCKLFGFQLTSEGPSVSPTPQTSGKRSCTKVHKQGSLVGRAIDISRLNNYEDLLNELERLFAMEGLLKDPENGWRILYTDSENDVMVVGDDPWHEFCDVVCKIHIHTKEEVEKMSRGIMMSDDTQSCLDQSKSSSVGLPDSPSSPTVFRI